MKTCYNIKYRKSTESEDVSVKIKSIFIILLITILTICCTSTSFAADDIEASSIVSIGNEFELRDFLEKTDRRYGVHTKFQVKLTHDIDCTSIRDCYFSSNNVFNGIFDGCGYTIRNLNGPLFDINNGTIINTKFEKSGDLKFEEVICVCNNNNGTIMNCIIDNSYIKIQGSLSTRKLGGCLCGTNNKGAAISNCTIEGKVSVATKDINIKIAGFCGMNVGNVQSCINKGTFYGRYIGQITFANSLHATVKACMFVGFIYDFCFYH